MKNQILEHVDNAESELKMIRALLEEESSEPPQGDTIFIADKEGTDGIIKWDFQRMTREDGYFIQDMQTLRNLPVFESSGNLTDQRVQGRITSKNATGYFTVRLEFPRPVSTFTIWGQLRGSRQNGTDCLLSISPDNQNWRTKGVLDQDFEDRNRWPMPEYKGRVNNGPGYQQGPVIFTNDPAHPKYSQFDFPETKIIFVKFTFKNDTDIIHPEGIGSLSSMGVLASASENGRDNGSSDTDLTIRRNPNFEHVHNASYPSGTKVNVNFWVERNGEPVSGVPLVIESPNGRTEPLTNEHGSAGHGHIPVPFTCTAYLKNNPDVSESFVVHSK